MKLPVATLVALVVSQSVPTISQQTSAASTPQVVQQKPGALSPVAANPHAPTVEMPAAVMLNTLLDGTPVKLRLTETMSSADAKTGQEVPFETTEDIAVDGVTVIPKGTQALGSVTEAQSKRSMGRAGKLDITISSTHMVNGQKVQLRATKDTKGEATQAP